MSDVAPRIFQIVEHCPEDRIKHVAFHSLRHPFDGGRRLCIFSSWVKQSSRGIPQVTLFSVTVRGGHWNHRTVSGHCAKVSLKTAGLNLANQKTLYKFLHWPLCQPAKRQSRNDKLVVPFKVVLRSCSGRSDGSHALLSKCTLTFLRTLMHIMSAVWSPPRKYCFNQQNFRILPYLGDKILHGQSDDAIVIKMEPRRGPME